ncbi:MAG: DUF4097 domain-containing protein [Chloroflexi bacterium]|nr:MAG: DUF4097 domain-containing protein [Chloroflexota bacterium]
MGEHHRLPPGARIKVITASGSITVIGEERDDVEVEPERLHVGLSDDAHKLEIKSKSGSISVRCPLGTNVSAGTISGSVRLQGLLGTIKASTVSGNIEVEEAQGDVDARSVSGSLTIESCGGECSLNSKSGSIRVGSVGKAARAATISGSVQLGTEGRGDVEVKTISGSITVRVPEGRYPRARFRSLSGRMHCDCPQGADFEVRGHSLSGSMEIKGR